MNGHGIVQDLPPYTHHWTRLSTLQHHMLSVHGPQRKCCARPVWGDALTKPSGEAFLRQGLPGHTASVRLPGGRVFNRTCQRTNWAGRSLLYGSHTVRRLPRIGPATFPRKFSGWMWLQSEERESSRGGILREVRLAISMTSGLEQKLYRGSYKIRKFLTVILCMSSHVIKKWLQQKYR